ncbi:uncharacterized protein LOC113386951 [Ctenocephalides felis]|uniref:uncharacterized protein LOC113386951 n=1 Tax=Ctenocephalides felis TaxID=7515 RepID=UPI000E6E4C2E|nr:uncharacterized protein LOC113386951 [Ctenocephalides felis]
MILLTKKNILAQISTGEGKSLIIVAFAIIKAMRRETLHVVTSSTVLAQRDATINNDIYSAFGINVGDNCDQVIDKRKQSYSRNKVIYGELSYFQRDYLLDTFFDENILGGNSFHNVMIDEVDSLLVDKGNNMLYLSHEIAGFDKIESVYIFIWNWINSPVKSEENFADIFNENDIHNAVMHEIYNIIDEKDLQSIDSGLTESEVTSLWFSLIDMKILDSKGKVVTNDIAKTDLDIILPEKFKTYSSRLAFLFRNCIDRPRNICLPNYLKGFVELHLKKWIRSAISALFMKEFQNYVIDVDRSGSSSDRNPIVVILDTDTGTDQLNSQWDEALHQFLQLKHGCKLTMQSLKSVYISNVSYFKLYKNKFGVTGTLGSEQELSLLRDLHEVTTVTIPTSKAKQFTPREPILCKTIDLWIEEIKKEAMSIIENESRSILIICETMHEVNLLHGKLRNVIEMVTYTRDYEEFAEKENLSCGTAIIATNLAGRGTDIKLSRELCERGGLHVCMTYLPGNCRVEEQGFGRSARRGEMGSGRLIVISDEADMTSLQMKRDEAELRRVSDIKSYYDRQIRTEESYFKQFTDTYEMLKRRVVNLDFSKVLLDSCLDKWAMWLDSISEHISMIENEQSKLFADNSLKALLSELNELKPEGTYENWVSHNQMRMTALAKCFLDTRRYDIALALFNEVIHNEPLFCETAYYYRALIYRNSTENIADMHKSLVEASKLFTHHRNQLLIYSNTVDIIKDTTNVGLIQIQSYNEQKKCTYEIYSAYLQSIDDILGSPITMETFSEMDGELLRTLHNDLIERNILRRSKANGDIDNRTLKAVANEFKISFTSLREILNETNELTDDKTFQQELKDRLNFCSKDNFWNELRCKNIITDVVEYISVKISKFKNYFEEYCDLASEQNKKSELSLLLNQTSVLFFDLENMRKDIYDENCLILEKVDLAAIIGNNNIAFMMNKDITTTNYVGIINAENCESSFLNSHDSITKQDFLDQNISEDDTDIILNHLTQLEILAKDDVNTNVYRLGEGFAKMDGQNLPSWNLYEETILRLMSDRFFFRMNLQEIRKCIDAGEKIALLDFSPNPHQLLYWSLVENRFVEKGIVCFSDVSIIEQYVSDIQNFIITKKIIRDMLITFDRIRDENLVNNIWAHLLEQRWILAGNTGLTDGKFVISYINICRINLDRHVEYEVILRDGLKNRVHLGAFGEMIYDKLKNLNTPDISKCKLVLGDSSGLNSYLYASEEMQALRICGLDEFLSFKARFSWKRCVKLVFGVCKILLSVAYRVISDIFHNTRDGISQRLFNSGFADIKESFAISNITWHDYIKYRMIDIMRNCVKYAKGFIYRGNRLSRSQNKISRVVAHATKSMEFQPSINIFLSNLNRDIQATIMERIDVELEIKLEEENSLLQKCSRQLGVETFQHIFMDYFVKKDNNIRLAIVLSNIKGEMMTKIRKITKKILAEGSNRNTIEKLHSTINISQEHINDLLETFEDIMNNSISEFSVDVPLDAPAEENIDTKLLKKFLHDITDNFLVENLMDPIFTEGARIMNDIFLKRDMEVYETTLCKDNSSDDVCLKMNLLENRRNAEESAQRKTIYCADVLTNTYNQKISCLLERVRDISSFAELLTENASINEVYLKLFVHVIPKVLNLDCLTIYVNYEDNSCQKYSTNETSGSPTVINISLVNGKFQLYDNGYVDDFKQFLKHPNNLYIALSGKYHCLITQERFAELIAKHIEKENELNSILKNIWKELDESSEQYVTESNLQDPINEEYNYEIDDIKKNLKAIVAKKLYKEDDDFEIIEKFDITLESQNIEAKPGTSTDT